ncbi:MAG: hypothetical protein ACRDH5_13415, partial [bacterium]
MERGQIDLTDQATRERVQGVVAAFKRPQARVEDITRAAGSLSDQQVGLVYYALIQGKTRKDLQDIAAGQGLGEVMTFWAGVKEAHGAIRALGANGVADSITLQDLIAGAREPNALRNRAFKDINGQLRAPLLTRLSAWGSRRFGAPRQALAGFALQLGGLSVAGIAAANAAPIVGAAVLATPAVVIPATALALFAFGTLLARRAETLARGIRHAQSLPRTTPSRERLVAYAHLLENPDRRLMPSEFPQEMTLEERRAFAFLLQIPQDALVEALTMAGDFRLDETALFME